jgi:ZIP family zinc transporter
MSDWLQAALWGVAAAIPLLIGAAIAARFDVSARVVGLISAFGAGALISAVSFELTLDAAEAELPAVAAVGLASGAIVYWAGKRLLAQRSSDSGGGSSRGLSLLMGATLDGIPESFILGLSVATGGGVSIPFLVAVAISNFPEGMASAAELRDDPDFDTRRLLLMWTGVVGVSAVFAGLGGWLGSDASTEVTVIANAFAAGALLTMVTVDLVPEADENAGSAAGLGAVLGFAVAFALHQLGG